MTVLRKTTVESALNELESYYEQLKSVVKGTSLDKREAHNYVYDSASAKDGAFVRVDMDKIYDAVGHFRVSVDSVKRLKSKEVKARQNGPYQGPADRPF